MMESFTPLSLLAGRIPVRRGHEREAVFHAAAQLLGTEHLLFVMSVVDGHAWYLAASSFEFGNRPDSYSPLANALPDARGYAGNGAYVVRTARAGVVAVIKSDDGLKTFSGPEKQVQRFIDMEQAGSTFHPVAHAQPWQSMDGERRRTARTVVQRAAMTGLAANLAAAVLWLGATMFGAHRSAELSQRFDSRAAGLRQMADKLNPHGSGNAFLREHSQLVGEVLRYPSGRIKQFKVEDGKSSWVARLPESASLERLNKDGVALEVRKLGDGNLEVEKKAK